MVRPLPLALLSLVLLAATGWWWFGDPWRRSGQARHALDPEKSRVTSAVHPDSPKEHPIIDDCAQCPKLVAIRPGSFQMGWAPEDEDPTAEGLPPHHVDIPQGFAVGKYEVTRDEYEQFVSETGRLEAPCQKLEREDDPESWEDVPGQTWRSPGFEQDRHHPVVCVSWKDAKAYVAWLSRKTGREYRLLTEAEWEYAARAHTTTARYRTDDPALLCKYINHGDLDYSDRYPKDAKVNDKCRDGYPFTSPVGALWENAFGLYDMLGNVWEWVEDCWNANYVGAPTDGRAWTSGNCDRHVLRGGGWKFSPEKARSAYRVAYRVDFRHNSAGFRVARSLSAGESVGLQADSP